MPSVILNIQLSRNSRQANSWSARSDLASKQVSETQVQRQLVSNPWLSSHGNMANNLRKELFQSTAYKGKKSKKVCFELPQSQGRYEWLKEVQVSEPTHLQELRRNSREFLEKVKARRRASSDSADRPSESTTPAVLKSFSPPLPNNMHLQQEEKSLGKDAFHKKTVESQPSGYEWWKEVEVELPTYFLKRRKERMLAEKVGWSRGNGQNKG